MFSFCQIYIIIICVCHPLLFLKFLRCHTKLFLKQFDKIRGRVYSDDITHLSCAVMPFGYQLGSLFQSYQTDKVRRRCSGECLNLTMQARPTHVDNLRQPKLESVIFSSMIPMILFISSSSALHSPIDCEVT